MTNRLICLDVVRGLAALSVLLTHTSNPLPPGMVGSEILDTYHHLFRLLFWCNNGIHPGVIVFIVLSGFCIHMPMARREANTIQPGYWSNYFRRRFLRIYPVMLLAMVLGLVAHLLTSPEAQAAAVVMNFGLNAALLTGWLPLGAPYGNEILLTVIVECLLYACYPGVLYLMRKRGGVFSLVAVAGLIYAVNAASLLFIDDPVYVQRNLWCFLLFWSAGTISAEMHYRWKWRAPMRWWVVLLLYATYVVAGQAFAIKGAHYLLSPLLVVLTSVTLCWLVQAEEGGAFRSPIVKLQYWLGQRSYSLYVIHWPLFIVMGWASVPSPYLSLLVKVLGSVVVAAVFYWAVESRFHRMAQALRTARAASVVATK